MLASSDDASVAYGVELNNRERCGPQEADAQGLDRHVLSPELIPEIHLES